MRRTTKSCIAAIALALATAPALAAGDDHVLTVTGEGNAKAAPDEATLSAGVVSNARTAAAALNDNARAMNAVFAVLRNAGVADKDIQTSGISVEPQFTEATNKQPQRIQSYQVSDNITVTVDDLSHLGATLDALVNSGANNVGGIAFGMKDTKPMMAAARADAVADAIARAQVLAKAAGVSLGPILSISEGYTSALKMQGEFRAMSVAAPAPTPIAAGQDSVDASVTIVWEIH